MTLRARVLVAEDSPAVARQLRRLLSDAFDVVAVVADGLSLLRVAREATPDVLVTDIGMPGMDGLQAAETLADEGAGRGGPRHGGAGGAGRACISVGRAAPRVVADESLAAPRHAGTPRNA